MAEPLTMTVDLAFGILNMISGVKTNHNDCEELGKMTQNVLITLEKLPCHVSTDPGVEAAVDIVNGALKKAQCAIEDCRDTSYFCALFSYRRHSCALKEALTTLQLALAHVPLAIVTKTTETHCRVLSISDRQHRQMSDETEKIERQKLFFKEQLQRVVSDVRHVGEQHTNNLTLDLIGFVLPDMYRKPLETTTKQVKEISRRVAKVKTNEKGCRLLEGFVKKTLEILEDIEGDIMSNIEALKALGLANAVLTKAQDAIEDCCSANCFHSLARRDRYSSALQASAEELHDVLSKMPFEQLGISENAKSQLENLLQELLDSEFDEVVTNNQNNVSMRRIRGATSQIRAEPGAVNNPSDEPDGRVNEYSTSDKLLDRAFKCSKAIMSNAHNAKTHHDKLQQLKTLANRTHKFLEQLEFKEANYEVSTWLRRVNDVLSEGKIATSICCNMNIFKDALNHSNYLLAIGEIEEKLKTALLEAPLSPHERGTSMQSEIVDMTQHVKRGRFGNRAIAAQKMKSFKVALEKNSKQSARKNKKLTEIIRKAKDEQDQMREKLKKELQMSEQKIPPTTYLIEKPVDEALNQMETVASTSQNTSNAKSESKKGLRDSLICPISKEVMTDPVLLKETGMTYDCLEIETWFRGGHRYDPLTNVELLSQELIPNHAVRELCHNWMEVYKHPSPTQDALQEQAPKVQLSPGLYEGHGWFNIASLTMHVFQVLLLEPNGRALGYTLYGRKTTGLQGYNLEVGKGEWNDDTLKLFFEDGWYHYQGSFSLGNHIKHAKIEWKGEASTHDIVKEKYLVTFFYSTPPIAKVVRMRPGILQMESATILKHNDGAEYTSKLVVSLEIDFSASGCMWFEWIGHDAIEYTSRIKNGRWDSDGSLAFQVQFLPKKTHDFDVSATHYLKAFSITGILRQDGRFSNSTFVAKVKECTDTEISLASQEHYTPLDFETCLEYPYLRETSPLLSHLYKDPLKLFHESRNHELESGDYFIRADFDDGCGPIPYYLHVWKWSSDFISSPDVHVSWNSCSPIQGHPYWHCAEVWRVERVHSTENYTITLCKTHRNKTERNTYVGKSLNMWMADDSYTEHGDCYLCVRDISRTEDQCLWTIRKHKGSFCLLLEAKDNHSIEGGTSHYLSLPILERDRRHNHTRYAPLSENLDRALKVTFETAH